MCILYRVKNEITITKLIHFLIIFWLFSINKTANLSILYLFQLLYYILIVTQLVITFTHVIASTYRSGYYLKALDRPESVMGNDWLFLGFEEWLCLNLSTSQHIIRKHHVDRILKYAVGPLSPLVTGLLINGTF